MKALNIISVPLFIVSICFSHLHHGTIAVDAIRYAHISKLILENGDWINLYDAYDERPYANKPPLLFWILALFIKAFGFSTFVAKLPAVLFAFAGMLLLWYLANKCFGERAALFTIIGLAVSPFTGKALIDLNFEGMVLFGTLLCLVSIFHWEKSKSPYWGILYGLGLLFLLQSKPPYIILVLIPTAFWMFFIIKNVPWAFAFFAIPFSGLGASWFILAGSSYTQAALQNQVEGPLTISKSMIENSFLWLKGLVENFPFAAIAGIPGLYLVFRSRKTLTLFHKLLLLWPTLAIPIILLVDNRARYLFIPVIPLLIFGGLQISKLPLLPKTENILKALLAISVLSTVIFVFTNIEIHRSDSLIRFVENNPTILGEDIKFCSDHKKDYRNWSAAKDTLLLFRLELGKSPVIVHSGEIQPSSGEAIELYANDKCFKRLKEIFPNLQTLMEDPTGVRKIMITTG